MRWIAGLAARRVVWIVVGLVVYAALGVVGVRAADYSLTAGSVGGNSQVYVRDWTGVTAGTQIRLQATVTSQSGAGSLNYEWNCGGTYETVSPAVSGAGTYEWIKTVPAGCTNVRIYLYGASIAVSGGTLTTDYVAPTPSPTPTPVPTATPTPTPDPICTPYCEVALASQDRARLDELLTQGADSAEIVTYGLGVVVFFAAVTAVSVGLRR